MKKEVDLAGTEYGAITNLVISFSTVGFISWLELACRKCIGPHTSQRLLGLSVINKSIIGWRRKCLTKLATVHSLRRIMGFGLFFVLTSLAANVEADQKGIWIGASELRKLPIVGRAWNRLKAAADNPLGVPCLRDQNQKDDVYVLAKGLVYARTGEKRYRKQVVEQIKQMIGTEIGGKTLALGRNLVAYVIAADLVNLPPKDDRVFRAWLRQVLTERLQQRTLQSTQQDRPNNWGTHAGASRAAIAVYLGDSNELETAAQVFRGYLGERTSYAGFKYGEDLSWQCDPSKPVGINPKGCKKFGHLIDGILPDDQRRGGSFQWPPPKENYVYEALQGAIVQAVIFHRAGYNSFDWGDKALLRAYQWLHEQANFPPEGDDTWQLPVIDYFYGTDYWDGSITRCGKNMCWTDWTHKKKP